MKTNKIFPAQTLMLIVLLTCLPAYAQVNYKVHSIFVYKFSQYVEWPNKDGDFVIGVMGNSAIISELEAIAESKKIDTRNIVVKKLTASSDLSECHILFIPEGQSKELANIAGKVQNKPILLISETSNGAAKGASINFIIVSDKMRFELNKSNLEKQGLKVSSELAKLAILVG